MRLPWAKKEATAPVDSSSSENEAAVRPIGSEKPATGDTIETKQPPDTHPSDVDATRTDSVASVEDESKYLTGLPLTFLTIGLSMTTFVIALDNTIIATAIPRITTVFNSLDDVGWYGSSYLLTTTSLQPSFGKVYTYFNVKWTFIVALTIFELGSVLCGAATSSSMLIIGRAVAGVGAAGLFSGGMTIIGYSVPLRRRPIFIGFVSSMFGIASVVGPILGGAFTDRMHVVSPSDLANFSGVSWRWCFYINLPIGAIAICTVFVSHLFSAFHTLTSSSFSKTLSVTTAI